MNHLISIEKTDTGYSAYLPDLPGCVSTGATREEVQRSMQEAIEFHLDGLRAEGCPIPALASESASIHVTHAASKKAAKPHKNHPEETTSLFR